MLRRNGQRATITIDKPTSNHAGSRLRGGIVLAEKDQISAFSREIIDFQRKNHLTDTEMALNSHVSVEHIHNIKSMREMPDSSVVATLKDYMEHKPSGK